MNTLTVKTNTGLSLVEQLNDHLDGALSVSKFETTLQLNPKHGKGYIMALNLKNGISYLKYNVTFKEDLAISHDNDGSHCIYFLYSKGQELTHSFATKGKKRHLGTFQTAILSSAKDNENIFYFSKRQVYDFCFIKICLSKFALYRGSKDPFLQQLKADFDTRRTNEDFSYLSSYNLKIADILEKMDAVSYDCSAKLLFKEALVFMMLAIITEHYKKDKDTLEVDIGLLNRRDLDQIRELSKYIKNYPEKKYTIKNLCAKTGLSSAKLQKGFWMMHNSTVTHYIRDIRVLAAEQLIRTTDLNISEIVYSIGLNSRSYFSKIFKKKYHCSPKNYQEHKQVMLRF